MSAKENGKIFCWMIVVVIASLVRVEVTVTVLSDVFEIAGEVQEIKKDNDIKITGMILKLLPIPNSKPYLILAYCMVYIP